MSLSVERRDGAATFAAVSLLSACACALLIIAACERSAPGLGGDDAGGQIGDDAGLDISDSGPADAEAQDASAPDAGEADAGDGGADAACTPLACNGQCGPIYDSCTQQNHQCGACTDSSKVCDIETHQCIAPKASCSALGAQCGTVKTSCGIHISCGDCASASQQCNSKMNQCEACQTVTCADLGYECGVAWNGCGAQGLTGADGGLAANQLDCGACADSNTVCNTAFHICEPKCATAPSDATVCAAAKPSGVECGYISNGCGGLANCGDCPMGQKCGTRGVANKCEAEETSVECLVLGQNCGTVQSACGGTASCGTCTGTNVCNKGVCGPQCTAKTCSSADYQGKCGTNLDNGCGGTITCGCAGGQYCSTSTAGQVGTCGTDNVCAKFTDQKVGSHCSNGPDPDFPKGDGSNLTCACTDSGAVCISGTDGSGTVVSNSATGHCCKNSNSCAANSCNTSYKDTCTGATVQCTCGSGFNCENNVCVANKTCTTYKATGAVGSVCSINSAFDRGDGVLFACTCASGVCSSGGKLVTGSAEGTCCLNANAACDGVHCNDSSHPYTVTDSCTNAVTTCGCNSARYCNAGSCQLLETCASYTTQGLGDKCSNNADPDFPKGDNTNLTCRCTTSGAVCISGSDGSGTVVTGVTTGHCCKNTNSCAANSCNTSYVDTCTGLTVQCTCSGSTHCSGTACVANNTCSTYGASGASGNPCSNGNAFDRGDGQLFACGCTSPGVCTSGGSLVTNANKGTCCSNTAACAADACATSVTNTCTNAPIACPSTCSDSSKHCDTAQKKCVANFTCSTYSANQNIGDPCSAVPSSAFPAGNGSNLTCGCSTATGGYSGNTAPNLQCTGSSSSAAGTCTCVPTSCAILGAGPHPNDGCGKSINCNG